MTAVSLGIVAAAVPSPGGAEPAHTKRSGGSQGSGAAPAETRSIAVSTELHHVFYAGPRPVRATYLLPGIRPMNVTIAVVRERDGAIVARWDEGRVVPGTTRRVTWDGTTDGRIQPEGRYTVRVSASDGRGAGATGAAASRFLRHRFPVRGAHEYGDGGARFGAARGGGGHQGQDVFADCGTPLVAARGGRVQFRGSHGRAGNYLVIDGAGTDVDYAYMHLRDPARFAVGRRVFTGQLIGFVGQTGAASACHLHFEMWSGPGWYAGGAPSDPLGFLRAWDRAS